MRFSVLFALVALASCSSTTEPGQRELGIIAGYNRGDPKVDLQVSGRRVTVEVTTYGNQCFTRATPEIEQSGLTATISPYVMNNNCPQHVLVEIKHIVSLEFQAAGRTRILVRGIDASTRTASNPQGETVTVERFVDLL